MGSKPRQFKFVYYCTIIKQMKTETLSYNTGCQPNAWSLLIGPDRIGSLAYDSFNRYISQLAYAAFDLYDPHALSVMAKEIFTERAEIRKIRVAFLTSEWCWLPTAIVGEKDAHKWLAEKWPEKPGHEWVADNSGPAEATAWVRVPSHLIAQLKKLSTVVEFSHAAMFRPNARLNSTDSLEIIRMGDWYWFSVWKLGKFHYAQPQLIRSVDDLLYLLSELTAEFKLLPDLLDVQLLGEWPFDAEEVSFLRTRFRNLHGSEVDWKNLPGEEPSHWYTPFAKILS